MAAPRPTRGTDELPAPAPPETRRAAILARIACVLAVPAFFVANGYRFAVVDHAIHLPFLLRTADKSTFPNDVLVDSMSAHPSLFWTIQSLLIRFVSIETLYLVIHALSVLAMIAGTAALGRALFPRAPRGAAELAAALIIVSRPTVASIATMDALMLNRTVSLGALLFALALGARPRMWTAFLVCGLTFNIHPTTAAHVAVMLFVVWVARRWGQMRKGEPAKLTSFGAPLWFVVGAAPLLLVMATARGGEVPFPAPAEWWNFARRALWFHGFASEWQLSQWVALAGPVVAIVGAMHSLRNRLLGLYLGGTLIVFVGGYVGTEWVGHPRAVHLHPLEVTRLLSYFAAVASAVWLAIRLPHRFIVWLGPAVTCFGLAFDVIWAVLIGVALGVATKKVASEDVGVAPARGWPRWTGYAAAVVVGLAGWFVPYGGTDRFPRTFEYALPPARARVLAQIGAKLPPDALVVVPPGGYFDDVRWGTRRSVFVTSKEVSEAIFDNAYAVEWRRRMDALCGCELHYDAPVNVGHLSEEPDRGHLAYRGFLAMDRGRLLELKAKFGVTHLLVHLYDARQMNLLTDVPLVLRAGRLLLYEVP